MSTTQSSLTRRAPKQQRARRTVDDVLEAVHLVVKRHGAKSITTNRIAETAGVSVGSLYQYFPDKRAIFTAIHDRHVADVQQAIEQTMVACAPTSFAEFVRELVHGLVKVHAEIADLHQIVSSAVPESAPGFRTALSHTFGRVLSPSLQDRYSLDETARMLFVLPSMVESLVHGVSNHSVAALSRDSATTEAIRTVLLYVNSYTRETTPRSRLPIAQTGLARARSLA